MGLLTDVFAATESQVRGLSPDDLPGELFPTVKAKSLDPVKFSTLENILVGTGVQRAVGKQVLVYQASDEGPWVIRISAELFEMLATLDQNQVKNAAQRWSQTDELIADRWSEPEVHEVLTKIVDLARQAQANGQRLFVWVCP